MGVELKIEMLSNKVEDFWQVCADTLTKKLPRLCGPYLIEELKKHPDFNFLNDVQEGDALEWYDWYAGPFAAASGFTITRNKELHYKYPIIVS